MDTEEKIIEAAQTVFLKKGLDGARMQEIADEAKINKALLHYYFRTKEKLFNAIFTKIASLAFPELSSVILSDISFKEKIDFTIDVYLNMLNKHPYVPVFILREINRDNSFLFKLVDIMGVNIQLILDHIDRAMEQGEIVKMNPRHLIINVVSLCVFPYAARPAIKHVLHKGVNYPVDTFMEERRDVLKKFIWDAIKVKN